MLFLVPQVAETQYRSWHLVPGSGSSMNNCTSQLDSWRWTAPACPVVNVLVPGYGEGKWTRKVSMALASTDAALPSWSSRAAAEGSAWHSRGVWREVPSPTRSGFPLSSGSAHTPTPATMANTRVQLTGLNPHARGESKVQNLAAAIWLDYETDFTIFKYLALSVLFPAKPPWSGICHFAGTFYSVQGFDSDLSLNFRA